jgi:hypothetical protein
MAPSRFRFDPSLASARYAVVDDYWELWATTSSDAAAFVERVRRWPLAFSVGPYHVYGPSPVGS